MSASARLLRIADAYPARVARAGVEAVRALGEVAGIAPPPRIVAVVGTNGKSSTALHLARLLTAAGVAAGVSVSPHLVRFGERVQIGGRPVTDDELAEIVESLHAAARNLPDPAELRFFDLLALAAATLFSAARVDVGIFEAGIGGRTDAVRALDPSLVLLTGIGLEHTELLGVTEEAILAEKLAVAPAGAQVLGAPLVPRLRDEARRLAGKTGLALAFVEAGGDWPRRNIALAEAAARTLGVLPQALELSVAGRLERLRVAGVDVLLDAAHNPQAWRELRAMLPPAYVAVVAASAGRPVDALRDTLANARTAFATTAWPERPADAGTLAVAIGAEPVEDPVTAVRLGLGRASGLGVPLVVFGSTYLLRHAYAALEIDLETRPDQAL